MNPIGIFQFDENGLPVKGRILATPNNLINSSFPNSYDITNSTHLLSVSADIDDEYLDAVFFSDLHDNHWAKAITSTPIANPQATFLSDGNVLTEYNFLQEDSIMLKGFSKLSSLDGSQQWAYYYRPASGQYNSFMSSVRGIYKGPDGSASINLGLEDLDTARYDILLQLDSIGTIGSSIVVQLPIDSALIPENQYNDSRVFDAGTDDLGNVYIAGRIQRDTGLRYCGFPNSVGDLPTNAFIAKFDANLEQVWCKELIAENFYCNGITIKVSPQGEVVFTDVSICELPIIAGKLSPEGELLWTRGYEFLSPSIYIADDGSMAFLTRWKYSPDGSGELGVILARVGPDGELPQCPQFDACLWVEDMELTTRQLEWERIPGPDLPDLPVQTAEAGFQAEPYCGTPPKPSPFFELPDTVCSMDCPVPDTLLSRLAQAVEWVIEGPQVDTILRTYNFEFCFPLPGTYLVRQTVWLMGCAESYEQVVQVLPPLSVSLGDDRVWCPDGGLLCPAADRNLQQYTWQDGSTGACYPVDTSGQYRLVASDGYCTDTDSVYLTLLADTLALPAFTYGSRDTSLCRDFLPYTPTISSPVPGLAFTLNGEPTGNGQVSIDQAGRYTIATEAMGCPLSDTLLLKVDECLPALYLPTAFSPNGDGRNDVYRPLGKDFEALGIQVFDRWGALLHEGSGAGTEWDGQAGNEPAPAGMYVIMVRYRHPVTGREWERAQEVSLVR